MFKNTFGEMALILKLYVLYIILVIVHVHVPTRNRQEHISEVVRSTLLETTTTCTCSTHDRDCRLCMHLPHPQNTVLSNLTN